MQLNQQRAAEEAAGTVRYLRPQYQAPGEQQAAMALPATGCRHYYVPAVASRVGPANVSRARHRPAGGRRGPEQQPGSRSIPAHKAREGEALAGDAGNAGAGAALRTRRYLRSLSKCLTSR